MDRSFLSHPDVIAASRQFVCVRLATYEDAVEGVFLKSFNITRSGQLENSVFVILAPDGVRQLVRAARSMRPHFRDAPAMAQRMNSIAAEHGDSAKAWPRELPTVPNVRLALDVAACDNQPLVVVFTPHAAERDRLVQAVADLIWREDFIGRFAVAVTSQAGELAPIPGAADAAGMIVIEPDRFGVSGKVLARVAADADSERLQQTLRAGLRAHQRLDKSFMNHIREGHQKGVFWETVIPVTDPEEQAARQRGRQRRP